MKPERCCSLCGVAGYEELLAMCIKCKSMFIHAYCVEVIDFIVPNDWVCVDCYDSDEASQVGKSQLPPQAKPYNGDEVSPKTVENRLATSCPTRLASPDKSCNGAELPKKGVENSTNMNRLATLRPREKLSSGTLAVQKRCKKDHLREHSPSAVSEPSLKQKSRGKTISKPVYTQVILHNSEHIKRYDSLKRRKIRNTRYFDEEMLDTLGLRKDISWMAKQVGWTKFLSMKEPTYILLTLEFLSTVNVVITTNDGIITFRLQNQDRQLTLEQFNNIFGFRTGGDLTQPKEYNADEFWSEISDDQKYDTKEAKANAIYNPCFRVMQRFMSETVFGRGRKKSIVRSRELMHLWAMVETHNLDTGKFLALHLQSLGKYCRGSKCEIVVGGLITKIARYFNVNMEGLAEATGSNKIDLGSCLSMKMIECHDNLYSLRLKMTDELWPLPDPARTTIQVRDNWKRTFQRGDKRRR